MRSLIAVLARRGLAWRAIGVALLIASVASAQSSDQPAEPGWTADANTGCKVWNPAPAPNESVTWTGACVDGFADGVGVEQWYEDGRLGNRIEGQFSRGWPTGTVTVTYPGGVQYIGELGGAAGGPSGVGTIIFSSGNRFKGKVLDGWALPEGDGDWFFKNEFDEIKDRHELKAWSISVSARARRLSDLGRYAEAEPLLKRALTITENDVGPDHPDTATSLADLALLYTELGRYAEAEALQKRALAAQEKSVGPDDTEVATILDNLAQIYNRLGRYAEAEPLDKRALAIREKALGPDHLLVAISLGNLAVGYSHLGRYAEAEPLYKRALAAREKSVGADHTEVATILDNLALHYDRLGRYAEAEPLHKRALAIREKALGPDHPYVAISLNNLAQMHNKLDRYGEAEPLHKRALAIREKALGPDHPSVATSLNHLADIYSRLGRYGEASPLLRRVIGTGRANRYLLRVVSALRIAKNLDQSEALSMSLSLLQASSMTGAGDAVSKLAQRFSIGSGEQATLIRRDQDLANQWLAMDKLLTEQFSKASEARNKAAEAAIRQRLISIETERKEIAASLAAKFPAFTALTKPPVLSVADIQALIEGDEALVAFDFADKGYLWVITRDSADWAELPTSAAKLADDVKALRATLAFENGEPAKPFDATLAYKIYQQTLAPLADKFAGKKRLSIYTNGALSSIPLQLLVTKDPAGKAGRDIDWLVKSAAITNLPSIYSLKASRRGLPPSAARKPMVAFADPVFSREARIQAVSKQQQFALRGMPSFYNGVQLDAEALAQSLKPLPGTRREVEAVARSMGASRDDLYFGLRATVETVQETKLDQYKVVYFATHALVSGDLEQFAKTKAEPALALTFPEKPTAAANGLLPASEVAQLKLDADWVVLSACNTAAGDQPGAEALSGLARAFIYAGARSLLVSHWEVSDTATANLMRRVFDISAKQPSLSHGEALREAELQTLRAARNNKEAHPALWAPFVVVGEPLKAGSVPTGRQ